MKVNLGIWGKLTGAVTVLAMVAGVALVVFWYLPLIRQNERMRGELLKLNGEVKIEENTGKRLKAAIEALQHDPKTVERLAREKLGYAKPGETIIRFEEPAAAGGPR